MQSYADSSVEILMAAPQALLGSGATLATASLAAGSQLPDTPAQFGVIVGFGVLVAGAVVWLDRWRNSVHAKADVRADAAEERAHKAEMNVRDAELIAANLEAERLRSQLADVTAKLDRLQDRLNNQGGTTP